MRIFKNKPFSRFTVKSGITDIDLRKAISAANRGLIDADLGGGVIKQRIARTGQGKSGGFRTVILIRIGEIAFFVHGFAKNEVANIRDEELVAFRLLAREMLNYDESELAQAVARGALVEITEND